MHLQSSNVFEHCFGNCREDDMKPFYENAETALIGRASSGDLDAFNQLVITYQNMAYHHAYNFLGDTASAKDAAQESFIKAFQNIGRFRGGSFRGWLLKI